MFGFRVVMALGKKLFLSLFVTLIDVNLLATFPTFVSTTCRYVKYKGTVHTSCPVPESTETLLTWAQVVVHSLAWNISVPGCAPGMEEP